MPSSEQLIIIDNDTVLFDPSTFSPVIFIPPIPTTVIKASGKAKGINAKICLEGDEKKIKLNCGYMLPSHPIPGAGILEITDLGSSQKTSKTKDSKKKVITKGDQFDAKFTVNTPAQVPTSTGPQPSSTSSFNGKGKFPAPKNSKIYAE